MGRYIDDILQPGEKVIYSANEHWIIFWQAILAAIIAVAALVGTRLVVNEAATLMGLGVAAIMAAVALIYGVKAWFQRWTTETYITSERVVHKQGFIKRSTFEMNLDKVEGVDVNQSVLGRILDYGDVVIQGVGDGEKPVRMIASPLQFRNHITTRGRPA
ncbi:MAG: PH domain-containing protein [Pseudomonadota bacterium]